MKTKIILSLSALLISSSSISAKIGMKALRRTAPYVCVGAIRAQNSLREQRKLAEHRTRQEHWLNQTHLSMLVQDDEAARQEQLLLSSMRAFDRAFTISPLVDDEKKPTQRDCVRKEKKEPTIKDTVKDPPKKDKEKEVETKEKQDSK